MSFGPFFLVFAPCEWESKHFIINIILPGAETEEDEVKALSAQFDKSLHFD